MDAANRKWKTKQQPAERVKKVSCLSNQASGPPMIQDFADFEMIWGGDWWCHRDHVHICTVCGLSPANQSLLSCPRVLAEAAPEAVHEFQSFSFIFLFSCLSCHLCCVQLPWLQQRLFTGLYVTRRFTQCPCHLTQVTQRLHWVLHWWSEQYTDHQLINSTTCVSSFHRCSNTNVALTLH